MERVRIVEAAVVVLGSTAPVAYAQAPAAGDKMMDKKDGQMMDKKDDKMGGTKWSGAPIGNPGAATDARSGAAPG